MTYLYFRRLYVIRGKMAGKSGKDKNKEASHVWKVSSTTLAKDKASSVRRQRSALSDNWRQE